MHKLRRVLFVRRPERALPGLNAASNHRYIPHNCVGTMVWTLHTAYWMAVDLAGFLATYDSAYDGNLLDILSAAQCPWELPLHNVFRLSGQLRRFSDSYNRYEAHTSHPMGTSICMAITTRLWHHNLDSTEYSVLRNSRQGSKSVFQ